MTPRLGRRAFLGGAGLVGLGGAVGAGAGAVVEHAVADHTDGGSEGAGGAGSGGAGSGGGSAAVRSARARAVAAVAPPAPAAPAAAHQMGIAERPAAHLVLAAYDLRPAASARAARDDLRATLRAWSSAVAMLMAGRPVYADDTSAAGLSPAALTVTIGVGASALRRAGLETHLPGELEPIAAFTRDRLDPDHSDGDLAVQICAEDPIVVTAAARQLARLAAPTTGARWVRRGFRRTAAAAAAPDGTPRNLMGQLDGTDNPVAGTPQFDLAVWAGPPTPGWMRGGSYLVARRIQMLLDRWDTLSVAGQEKVIGRRKDTGAPLSASADGSAGRESTLPDFTARDATGALAIPSNAHVRLSHPDVNGGVRMLRRGYSYDDGPDATGQPDAGLIFLAYQADPRTAFTPIQHKLDASDALSTFIRHTANALFAVPPAAPAGGYVGQQLLEG